MEFQTLAEFLAQLYPKEAEIFRGKRTESKVSFYFAGTCAIAGMMCLRLFILYAGQMNTIV